MSFNKSDSPKGISIFNRVSSIELKKKQRNKRYVHCSITVT